MLQDLTGNSGRKKPETRPFSIRLTDAEKALLLHRAGCLPLGAYIRDRVLGDGGASERVRWRNPVKDHEALGRVLAALGQSRIANNLNQLAKAVNIGVLPVDEETEADLGEACRSVSVMRSELMKALGLSGGDQP
ncbi:plasmid mobilization relaxosome protein MobC [Nitratireductor sp. CAU 1489]|uniref:Plasmid mobilization relaxosome protein MobC n=1 Tax=Nitratireductor arenosus TaxID=2682096 RepID=A0A844QCJ2_9HYPH|nr:plasmid mobilization relaxosome protein MobC [Nitratireductor arenosus]MVA96975.1 plasmid mobilization relaxosome protein MobC [Nitratireductor arenosus]